MTNGISPNPKRLVCMSRKQIRFAVCSAASCDVIGNQPAAPLLPPKPEPQDTQASAIAFVGDNVGNYPPAVRRRYPRRSIDADRLARSPKSRLRQAIRSNRATPAERHYRSAARGGDSG